MKATKFIWKNGKFLNWESATTHVLTHALHYGTAMFEGIRAYETSQGPAIFRAKEHYVRLLDSLKIYRMKSPYTVDQYIDVNCELINKNKLKSCYIRPIVYYGYKEMGLNPKSNPIDAVMAAWEWGSYLGEEGLKKGIRCKVSSWARIDGRILPTFAKCSANYANSILAKQEALDGGFDEAIVLNLNGNISEGPGENLFMIRGGKIYSPSLSDGPLPGITAASVIQIAKDLGYEFEHKSMSRDELFTADELFFTGTAAEVTPIREIDGRVIGSGKRGPITEKIQAKFFDIVQGKDKKYFHWLTFTQNHKKRK